MRVRALFNLVTVALLLPSAVVADDCLGLIGQTLDGGRYADIDVVGDYAYISGKSNNLLLVFDVSNPSAPVQVGYSFGPAWEKIAVDWPYVFQTGTGLVLRIIDVTNPSAPIELIRWMAPLPNHQPEDVDVSGDFVFVGTSISFNGFSGGLWVIDVSTPSAPLDVGSLLLAPDLDATALEVSGGFAFVGAGDQFFVIDISNPAAPAEVANLGPFDPDGAAGPHDLAVFDGFAYIAHGPTLSIVDVRNPLLPSLVASITSPDWSWIFDVGYEPPYVYLADYGRGVVRLIDVSSPSSPFEVKAVTVAAEARGILVKDGFVYSSEDSGGLEIFTDCGVFVDGFESGDVSAWSGVSP